MPVYNYLARDRSGQILRNVMEAQTPMELRSRLNAMEVQLVSFEACAVAINWQLFSAFQPSRWLPMRSRDIELTLHQLAIMLRSGLKLLDAIKALQLQADRRALAKLLEAVYHSVSQGNSLSDALAAHKSIPEIVIQMVNVGEQTGSLDRALEQCKDYLYQRRMMLNDVRMAMAYPAVVTASALSIAGYLILFVIPQLQKFLVALGRDLPAMTQSLIDFTQWLQINGPTLMGIFSCLVAVLIMINYSGNGRVFLDRCLLRLPVVGGVLRLSGTTSLSSSLEVMLSSGTRLVEAIRIAAGLQRNRYLASLLHNANHEVTRGRSLAPSLAQEDGFMPILSSMVEVAERSGGMDRTLGEVARLCEAELKVKIKRMSQMVEPLVIVLAGGIVGYVYIAFFLALMSAGGNFR